MNCLKDYIGIKELGSTEPLSGLYIDQLPGISLESVEKIAKSDFATTWDDIQTRSGVRLEKDLRIALRNRFKLKAIKSSATIKQAIDTTQYNLASAHYKGVVIDLGIREGSFMCLQIDKVIITLTEDVATLTLKIFDGDGNTLETKTKTTVTAGAITINIAKKYFVRKLFIAVDATAVKLYSSALPDETISTCCDCICTVCDTCEPEIYGAYSAIASPGELTKSSDSYGIEIGYSVMCDYTGIICTNKPEFTDVWMYLLGAELMLERIHSNRKNSFTTIDKEQARELNDYYSSKYEDALAECIKALDIEEEDCCIQCNPLIKVKEALP